MARKPQTFVVIGQLGRRYTVQALGDYHRYWMDAAKTTRNPKFDQAHSGLILSVKTPTHPNYSQAIKSFAKMIAEVTAQIPPDRQIELVVVPSCTRDRISPGLQKIAETLCKSDKRLSYRHGSLRRTATIAKLATGGDRGLHVHMDSISFTPHPRNRWPVLVLDDVSTTGNSVAACADLISQHDIPIFGGIVLGKTVDE
jgi:predicted amidophosphoribosyltransferase